MIKMEHVTSQVYFLALIRIVHNCLELILHCVVECHLDCTNSSNYADYCEQLSKKAVKAMMET